MINVFVVPSYMIRILNREIKIKKTNELTPQASNAAKHFALAGIWNHRRL